MQKYKRKIMTQTLQKMSKKIETTRKLTDKKQ